MKYPPNGTTGPHQVSKNHFQRKFKAVRDGCESLTVNHTIYSFRHTFAMEYMKKALNDNNKYEVKIIELKEILGHKDLKETQKYLRNIGYIFMSMSQYEGIADW